MVAIPSPWEIEHDVYDLIHPADKIEVIEHWMTSILTNLRAARIVGSDCEGRVEAWEMMLPVLAEQAAWWRSMLRVAPENRMRGRRKSENSKMLRGEQHVLERTVRRRWKWR